MSGRLLGLSDCEAIHSGFLAQPTNALSSLVYVGVGAWIAARGARRGTAVGSAVFGAAVAANGVGSFLYHGPQGPGAAWTHDVAVLAVVLFLLVLVAAVRLQWSTATMLAVFFGALAAVGGVVALRPTATNALVVVLGASTAVAGGFTPAAPAARVALGATFGVSLLTNVLGRTGSPWCRPSSRFQWHGVWHVLSAAVLGGVAVAVVEPRLDRLRQRR